MIQRIQTLYLLAVVILGIVLIWQPVLQFVTPNGQIAELRALGLETLTNAQSPMTLNGVWGLMVITLLIPVLALVDIFLYKKRILQARLNIFTVMLCLGYYGVLGVYIWFAKMNLSADWHIIPWASIPAISLVLTMMATRRILRDEALVRAADRIR